MKKVEQYIKNYTRNCSNEILSPYPQISNDIRRIDGEPAKEFSPWLAPDHARRIAEIVREETIKEVCEWLDNHTMLSEKWYIEDLKKHLEGKV